MCLLVLWDFQNKTQFFFFLFLFRSTESGDPLVSWAQMLDSLGGRSTLVTEVTRETRQSEVVPLTDLRIRATRSSTQPADRRASASWSQHSSMVTQSWARPCRATGERESSPLLVSLSESNWGTANLMMSQGSGRSHQSPPRPLSAGAWGTLKESGGRPSWQSPSWAHWPP